MTPYAGPHVRQALGYSPAMGLLGTLTKAGIAKKVFNEARKPENQRRIKEAVANFQNKRKGGRPAR